MNTAVAAVRTTPASDDESLVRESAAYGTAFVDAKAPVRPWSR